MSTNDKLRLKRGTLFESLPGELCETQNHSKTFGKANSLELAKFAEKCFICASALIDSIAISARIEL